MKLKRLVLFILLVIPVLYLNAGNPLTKDYKINKQKSKVKVTGTSTLHDWEEEVPNFDGDIYIVEDTKSPLSGITSVNVVFSTKSFKSDENAMDKKTHEALKAEQYPSISFNSQTVKQINAIYGKQQVSATGKLTLAGVTKPVDVTVLATLTDKGEICIEGKKEISMADFNITPPVALLGTLKTGDKVNIIFSMYFSKL